MMYFITKSPLEQCGLHTTRFFHGCVTLPITETNGNIYAFIYILKASCVLPVANKGCNLTFDKNTAEVT